METNDTLQRKQPTSLLQLTVRGACLIVKVSSVILVTLLEVGEADEADEANKVDYAVD